MILSLFASKVQDNVEFEGVLKGESTTEKFHFSILNDNESEEQPTGRASWEFTLSIFMNDGEKEKVGMYRWNATTYKAIQTKMNKDDEINTKRANSFLLTRKNPKEKIQTNKTNPTLE